MGIGDFALSLRQLDRLRDGEVLGSPRPSVCRVLEADFGYPVKLLLGPEADIPLGGRDLDSVDQSDRTLSTLDFVAWIADQSGIPFDGVYTAVADLADKLSTEPPAVRAAKDHARSRIGRAEIAQIVQGYYGGPAAGFYGAAFGDGPPLSLSVVTAPQWVGLDIALDAGHQDFRLSRAEGAAFVHVAPTAIGAAVARLAAVEISDQVLMNNPLYRLTAVDVSQNRISATLGVTTFAAYALTADLLEDELLDSIAGIPHEPRGNGLPLRDLYLPSIDGARSLDQRICAGGPACLLAVATADDYLVAIQERSRRVINVPGRLAVIPKAFHQPLGGTQETALSESIERELEEELLGRQDLEELSAETARRAAPRHPQAISEPMRWLLEHPDVYHLTCTAFGINMLSGNYEFACTVIIDDPTWWDTYGDRVQANWEAKRLHCYSTRHPERISDLIADPRWSNEGLFALLEGLRSLATHDPSRVSLPPIAVSL
jgi:hypothetical protein